MAAEPGLIANKDVELHSPERAKLLLLIGAIVALIGLSLSVIPIAIPYLVRPSGSSFTTIIAVEAAIGAVGSLLNGTGFFLIFLGFAQLCRDSLPWILVVAVVMIVAGAIGALASVLTALWWLGSNGTFPSDFGFLVLQAIVQLATGVARGAALIVGLLALGRTILKKP